MPTYLAPGVFVEEVSSGVKPIAGVGTSTAGFVGIIPNTAPMPLLPSATPIVDEDGNAVLDKSGNETYAKTDYFTLATALDPEPINSWSEFEQKFGEIKAEWKPGIESPLQSKDIHRDAK